MWHLAPPSTQLVNWYKDTMLKGLCKRILKSKDLPNSVKEILLPYRIPFKDRDTGLLVELLIAEPMRSIQLNDDLMNRIRSLPEIFYGELLHPSIKKILRKTFAYDTEISKNKGRAYKLTHEQGRYTCTYCNRSYTLTVVRTDNDQFQFSGYGQTNNTIRIARPQLDHWLDKAENPLLSLNIYNLIPSCPICNSSVKGSDSYSLSTHVHPYLYDKAEPSFRFVISSNSKNPNFPFVVEIDERLCDKRERNMIKSLALKDIYSYHGMLEAKDILDWSIENSPEYLRELFKNLSSKYKRTTEEVFRMFFGTEYLPEKNLDRPLSKLKRDILIQIGKSRTCARGEVLKFQLNIFFLF